MNMVKGLLFSGVMAFGMLGLAGQAGAVTYTSCIGTGYNISTKVNTATACEISSATQDFTNVDPIVVNQDGGFFDIDSWSFFDKIGTGKLSAAGTASGQTGTFNLTSYFSGMVGDFLLVFKDGKGTTLVGYLLTSSGLNGSWSSPFVCPPFTSGKGEGCTATKAKDVSHISVYTANLRPGNGGPGGEVPLPAALPLLLTGLAGMGWLARKRKSA
jgi:hypothetical protein